MEEDCHNKSIFLLLHRIYEKLQRHLLEVTKQKHNTYGKWQWSPTIKLFGDELV